MTLMECDDTHSYQMGLSADWPAGKQDRQFATL
jgi:hypothetical protein